MRMQRLQGSRSPSPKRAWGRGYSKVLRHNLDHITQCYVTNDCQEFLQQVLIGQLKLITTPIRQELLDPSPLHINLSILKRVRGMGLAGQTMSEHEQLYYKHTPVGIWLTLRLLPHKEDFNILLTLLSDCLIGAYTVTKYCERGDNLIRNNVHMPLTYTRTGGTDMQVHCTCKQHQQKHCTIYNITDKSRILSKLFTLST